MAWFWFATAVLLLVWNVFLMRLLSIAQHDNRRHVRAQLAQDPAYLLKVLKGGDRS